MNRMVLGGVFAAGLAVLGWVAWGFVGASPLALAMTAVIAGVYLLGAAELLQFRAASASLSRALAGLQPGAVQDLDAWLQSLPAPLRQPVRQRIEGGRSALPGPTLVPYLVGLLVMLGMLGTFLGMVVTFHGAVFALEASSSLESIRTALAAPIQGLGLSFGTSVAGVASSAALGLMLALCRRERVAAVRALDRHIGTASLRPFSAAQRRQDLVDALRTQADVLPDIAQRLQGLMDGLERRHEQLSGQLRQEQEEFHRQAAQAYTQLASAVGASLQDSLGASARMAGETLRPVVEQAMAALVDESARSHQRLREATDSQLAGLSAQWEGTAHRVAETWNTALQAHTQANDHLTGQLAGSLQSALRALDERTAALLASVQQAAAQSQAAQAAADQERLAGWSQALESTALTLKQQWEHTAEQAAQQHRGVGEALAGAARQLDQSLQAASEGMEARGTALLAALQASAAGTQAAQAEADTRRLAHWNESLQTLAGTLAAQWRSAGEQAVQQQQAAAAALETAAAQLSERMAEQVERTLGGAARLMEESDALLRARVAAESRWTDTQAQRMDALANIWRTELAALRDAEAARGEAAVQRLDALQAAVATHLADLGAALEAPLTRLLQTAAEVPQAAAEVITQLRQEMARLGERDNAALAERTAMTEQLGELLQSVNAAAGQQRAAIESLVGAAGSVMERAVQHFSEALGAQSGKVDEVSAQVAASAVELASLGESFSHGVGLFASSSEQLVQTLQRIEGAIGQSLSRSDEQLAYYVAQAREVIDLSITSQQGIVEDLRRLHGQMAAAAQGVAA